MNHDQRKYHGQFEITDLVAEAVSNAAARRNQVLDSEDFFSSLSNEQAGTVKGGGIFNLQNIILLGGFLGRQIKS